ncbi:MAG: transposase [Phycisphaerae bacterium]
MGDIRVRRALIAVHDKTGVADFTRALVEEFGIEILSTGGTAKHLTEAGVPVTPVEAVTGFPEMLDGRVKTLHPRIHAAILADRDNPEHMRQLAEQDIKPIDMVVVNLYPFGETIERPDCTFEDAVEMIDIGGPCLLRAAAKNHRHVVVCNHWRRYDDVLEALRAWDDRGRREQVLREGAEDAFWQTSVYDGLVRSWLGAQAGAQALHHDRLLGLMNGRVLRYGENPHQTGEVFSVYGDPERNTPAREVTRADREMSFNNLVDADAALGLCAELARAHPGVGRLARPRGLKPAARASDTAHRSTVKEEPRASARAASRSREGLQAESTLRSPDASLPCWLLTSTTYGTWLPGDQRGFVSRAATSDGGHRVRNVPGTTYDSDQGDLAESARERMKGKPVYWGAEHARVVHDAFLEAATTHGISLIAFSIMRDHAHIVCQHADLTGAELLQRFKGVASRRLGQRFDPAGAPRWWTRGGSKRFVRRGDDPRAAIEYVCQQRDALVVRCFDAARDSGAFSSSRTAQAEARGSSMEVDACGTSGGAEACVVFIKHTNACGVGISEDPVEAYLRAYLGDPNAAMGGILAVNFHVDIAFAETVMASLARWGKAAGAGAFFVEVWLAPSFEDAAIEVIRSRKKWGRRVRLLDVGDLSAAPDAEGFDLKRITGGMLMQTRDRVALNEDSWTVVTERAPTAVEMADLRLAWLVCKHTKSNAITICKDGMLIGNGAGQMSRVMSCRIATWLARGNGHAERLRGASAASDAFFPFRDGPDMLIDAGVMALIQPGGSKRDAETIAACDERGVAMIFTGTRHFKH